MFKRATSLVIPLIVIFAIGVAAAFLIRARLEISGSADTGANGVWVASWSCSISGSGQIDSAVTTGGDLALTFSLIDTTTLIDCSRTWDSSESVASGINHIISLDDAGLGGEPLAAACTVGCGIAIPPSSAQPVTIQFNFSAASAGYVYPPGTSVDVVVDIQ